MKLQIRLMAQALKVKSLPVALKRTRNGYEWRLPRAISPDGGIDWGKGLSDVAICNFGGLPKMRARFEIASRYLAQVYPDSEVAFIQPRHVLKHPNWFGRFGGLPELAMKMKRAGLIKL
jgi:hypothetical protein